MDNNTGERQQKGMPWERTGRKNKERRDRYNPYKEPNPGILQNLTKSPREIFASEKVVKTFTKPPRMVSKARDTSKYCEFHQDYGHKTNACRELKNQIEKAVKSGRLAHLIKGIRKGKSKQTDTQLEEWIAHAVKAEPIMEGKEEPILMIGVVDNPSKRKEPPKIMSIEEMIFPPIRNRAPSIDPILISVKVYRRQVGRVQKEIREGRSDVYTTLFRFSSDQVSTLGEISLRITVGEPPHHRSEKITFLIVRPDSSNNMLFGRTTITELGMIPSTISHLPAKFKQELIKLLRNNTDVFAWQYSDMTGIPQTLKIRDEILVTEHKLNEDKKITPVQQKKRGMAPKRSAIASKEVEELKKAEILRETRYQTWVANTVMVKKTDGAWRMCVDFKDINKACPKDCYSLLEID
ncbi:hypothetical protein Tco_1104991 [Tanacetum coccineum]